MKETMIFLLMASLIILALFCLYRINKVRYALVREVWRFIDWISNRTACKAILPGEVSTEADIPYVNEGTSEQILDIYYPKDNRESLPVIIFTHGGGFIAGDKRQVRQYCMTLAKEGYIVFNINYRLAPRNRIAEQIRDVTDAIHWVNVNCDKYFGDKSKIVLAGDSAGAYLTALIACGYTNEKFAADLGVKPEFLESGLKGVLLFSGMYDLETGSRSGFPSIKSDIEMLLGAQRIDKYQDIDRLSVIKNVTGKFPKTFISSGAADWLHSESIELVRVLEMNQVYHRDCLFDKTVRKAMHDYQFHLELEPSKQCMKSVLEFLKLVTS